ncbi:MAG: DUF3122 domain-containing protein [Prochlorothrix sp.]
MSFVSQWVSQWVDQRVDQRVWPILRRLIVPRSIVALPIAPTPIVPRSIVAPPIAPTPIVPRLIAPTPIAPTPIARPLHRILYTSFSLSLALLLCLGSSLGFASPAWAAVQRFQEAPGQVVYQTRASLKDQEGHTWQVIAFKRIRANGESSIDLRLVGFPGTVAIDRTQLLSFTSVVGQSLSAMDTSAEIFDPVSQPDPNFGPYDPEPHVGQYDLRPLLADLRPELPWQIQIATLAGPEVRLSIPPLVVQDWQSLALALD